MKRSRVSVSPSSLHSDDYGYQPYSDEKIFTLLEDHKLRSISVLTSMVRGRTVNKLPQLANYQPRVKVGLHINLTEGKSLEKRMMIPSLTGKGGIFFSFWIFLLLTMFRIVHRRDIRKEVDSQIRFLLDAGITPDMIDSHQHIHAFSPVAEIVHDLARQYEITDIRSYANVKAHTWTAKITYLFLKIGAAVSYFITYQRFGLPASWQTTSRESWSFMDWEGERFDIQKEKDRKTVYVIHPFLPFDSNTSYTKLI